VVLPQEYAAWLERRERDDAAADGTLLSASQVSVTHGDEPADTPSAGFSIVSPRDGDRYQVPPGVDPRFSTIALRAAGARDPSTVRWSVDGSLYRRSRLPLTPGEHVIRAFTPRGDSAEVRIVVE
jgi:hypothetical protein